MLKDVLLYVPKLYSSRIFSGLKLCVDVCFMREKRSSKDLPTSYYDHHASFPWLDIFVPKIGRQATTTPFSFFPYFLRPDENFLFWLLLLLLLLLNKSKLTPKRLFQAHPCYYCLPLP